MDDSQSSGGEGQLLENFVRQSDILKNQGANHRNENANKHTLDMRPANPRPGIFKKNQMMGANGQKGMRHGIQKQLKSLNLSKRGLVDKKKKINKMMKHKLKKAAAKSLKQKLDRVKEKKQADSPEKAIEEDGQKIYPCHVLGCGKLFQDSSSLRKHLMTHGER